MSIDVSIIFVNYKSINMAIKAIDSVISKSKGFSYEIIVVDNSCDEKEFQSLKEQLVNKAIVIKSPANLGFGKANNLGASIAKGKYLYFLNTDTLLVNNAIFELFDYMEKNNDAGIVGSNLYTIGNKPNHSYYMKQKNLNNEIHSSSFFRKFLRLFRRDDFNYSRKPKKIDGYVCGASLMIRTTLFKDINGFSSRIFMYAEESLLCFMAQKVYKTNVYNVPNSKIIHFEGGSMRGLTDKKIDMFIDGTYDYYFEAFGEKEAKRYLFEMRKVYRKMARILCFFPNKHKEYMMYYHSITRKINAISYKENKDMRILVTGVKGQLGYDCIRELNDRGYTNVKGIDIEDLDITDEQAVNDYIIKYNPDVVMHNAAWTAVDKAEQMPDKVYEVNALGPKYIAEACKKVNAKMVYISTDYVFDGNGNNEFNVDDPKNGLSVYGRTKSQGEDFVTSLIDNYFIVRISWVFGKNGNNFVKTMLKLADMGKTELNVVCDQFGSVTYTYDLSKLLCDMIETDKYGVYHATNEGIISWAEFAEEIFKQANKNVKVNFVTTEEYKKIVPNQADRPLNSRMSKESLTQAGFNKLPNWKDALNRYLKELN